MKKRKITFIKMISCWNRYLLMYPHKCTLKNLKKKYQEKSENAYLRLKNARASRALRWALDPGRYWLAPLALRRFATSAKSLQKFLGPPLDQILDPLVRRQGIKEKKTKKQKLQESTLKQFKQETLGVKPTKHHPPPGSIFLLTILDLLIILDQP